eukprot:TRINITY_DN24521_c0_g1_i3.p1 TRINITY_DN24521_c0_g1~~TRINITY_DN24521_c0_g1_i3.p1  ORF type:complete len:473 (-),score=120.78 TRINITY_DN24521_c0_g1_i3:405-1823(-)
MLLRAAAIARRASPSSRALCSDAMTSTRAPKTEIQRTCDRLYEDVLRPLNLKLFGPLNSADDGQVTLPFVFLLGNHSSGKSSFINYMMGREVQTTGVAPTDDSFTIIAPGDEDTDRDGPAVIGNPDLGFSSLRAFGPNMINHTQLKVRKQIAFDDMMMVDSPGMIDSPGSVDDPLAGRGYDFSQVVKWYAERADVIFLFFDPDKPGTTGETLEVLTTALSGMDHKLHIVLNKADQFNKIHDFARAYGSLCWNLSKVIHRKDLPRIYTMCLPVGQSSSLGISDLESTRDEVVAEAKKAPVRRHENLITRLLDHAMLLKVHMGVLGAVQTNASSLHRKLWGGTVGVITAGQGAAVLALSSHVPEHLCLGIGLSAIAGGVASHVVRQKSAERAQEELFTQHGLDGVFERAHAGQLALGDEYLRSLWLRVRPKLMVALSTHGLGQIDKVRAGDMSKVDQIVNHEVKALRRMTTPVK